MMPRQQTRPISGGRKPPTPPAVPVPAGGSWDWFAGMALCGYVAGGGWLASADAAAAAGKFADAMMAEKAKRGAA